MGLINNQLLDNIAFKAMIENTEYLENFEPEYFDEKIKQILLKFAKDHFSKFHEAPTKEQLKEIYRLQNLGEDTSLVNNYIDLMYNVDLSQYTKDWLDKSIKAFISIKQLDSSVKNLITYLKTTPIKMENVDTVLQDARNIITEGTDIKFGIDIGADIFNPDSYVFNEAFKISSGYNFIDTVTEGGFSKIGLHIFSAPPKTGKSLWLMNMATEMIKLGMNGAFISLEMPEYAMLQRFGPKLFGVKINDFREVSQNQFELQKHIQKFKNSSSSMGNTLFSSTHPGELFLKEFPTSTATTNDVRSYLTKLQEKKNIKLDFVVIDYINIMANWRNPNSDNTYMKIKQIAEDLRAISQSMGICILSATQTKRGVEDSSDFNVSDIAESSGLGHTADSLWGISQSPEMYARREYTLKNLLNRHGGMKFARQRFTVDYEYMNIRETDDPIQENPFG